MGALLLRAVDKRTLFTRAYPMAHKSEVPECIDNWCETVGPPDELHTDNGGENDRRNRKLLEVLQDQVF